MSDFDIILDQFWTQKWSKKTSKIREKSREPTRCQKMPMLSHLEAILGGYKTNMGGVTRAIPSLFSPTPVLPEAPKSDGSDDRDEEPREQQE